MKTVELFAGIGGFRIAADFNQIETVWANDMCPKACKVYRNRFGDDEIHEGDIKLLLDGIPEHDLLTGGFPCQPFSSAGKKEGTRDPRGTLFQSIVDVLRSHKPKYFVLENVKRLLTMEQGQHFGTILSTLADLDYHIEWRLLNAMHLGLPQNRQRVFITGTRLDSIPNGEPHVKLASAEDLQVLADSKLHLIGKSSLWKPIAGHKTKFPTWGMAQEGKFFGADLTNFSHAKPHVFLKSVLEKQVGKEFDFTESTLKWLSDNTPVNRLVQGVEILSNQAGGARMGYTIFGINGIAPTLTCTTSRHYERYAINGAYRRLTNIEYARIQGFPDDHAAGVSVYDQYPLYGNAVPPPMAAWVLERLLSETAVDTTQMFIENNQQELFAYGNQRAATPSNLLQAG